jgi:hypothetical protein
MSRVQVRVAISGNIGMGSPGGRTGVHYQAERDPAPAARNGLLKITVSRQPVSASSISSLTSEARQSMSVLRHKADIQNASLNVR